MSTKSPPAIRMAPSTCRIRMSYLCVLARTYFGCPRVPSLSQDVHSSRVLFRVRWYVLARYEAEPNSSHGICAAAGSDAAAAGRYGNGELRRKLCFGGPGATALRAHALYSDGRHDSSPRLRQLLLRRCSRRD